MANVVRHDVVQIDFDTGSSIKQLQKLQKDINELKKKLTGGVGDEAFDDLKESAEDVVKPVKKVKEEVDKVTDSVSEMGETAEKEGESGLKKMAGVSFKALAIGIGAAAVAVTGLVTKAVQAYADFEQLQGGVQKLFGAGGQSIEDYAKSAGKTVGAVKKEYDRLISAEKTVFKNANNAYKTTGMGANQYMESVTGFSASLVTSLGGDTKAAADLADMALRDMSDNANVFGTDMDSVLTVYQGLAKDMYSTLDNLKLGYGGTKSGAEKLVADAAKIDKSVKSNDLSFGNMVKAIHAIQTKMGILGTTKKEASKTVTGSINAMKAAWTNMLTAIGSGENIDQCFDNLIESAETVLDNIAPIAERALVGLGTIIDKVAPKLAEKLPELVEKLLPSLIKAAIQLVKGLIKALPNIVKSFATAIVDIFKTKFPFVEKIGNFFTQNADKIATGIKVIVPAVLALVAAFKGFKAVKSITSLFGGKDKGGKDDKKDDKGKLGWFKELSKMKIKDVLKGVANLAIIIGALGALLWIATKVFKGGINFKEMLQVIVLIGVLGKVGEIIGKAAGTIGKAPVKTVAKGVLGMGIALVAIGGLLWITTKLFADGVNFKEMLQVISLIGILGVVGGVLAGIAAVVGCIPFPVVLSGIANIALVIGALEAVLVALGALSKIPGFKGLIESGGELLAMTFGAIGKAIGSLVGGLAEGVTGCLPKIGQHFSAFAKELEGTDFTPISGFFGALASVGGLPSSGGIFQMFTGDPYTGLVKMIPILPRLGISARAFMIAVGGTKDFSPIATLLSALANVKGMPSAGGFFQMFTGDPYNGLVKMLPILPSLGKSAKDFFTNVGSIKDFTPISSLLNALSSVKGMPSSGGFFQLFTGDPYTGLMKMVVVLPSLGKSVGEFFTNIGDRTDFTAISSLLTSLASVKELPKSGGFAQFFTGDVYSGLAKLIFELPLLGSSVGAFYTALGDRTEFSLIPTLFNALSSVSDLPKAGGFAQFFTGSAYTALGAMIIELPALGKSVKSFFGSIEGITDFTRITALFSALGGLDTLIGEKGGLFDAIGSFFNGSEESAVVMLGKSLKRFANDTTGFFAIINSLNLTNLNGMWMAFANVKGLDSSISTIVTKIGELPQLMSDALRAGGESLSTALVDVWKDAVKASVEPVNKVLDAANWILKEFGSNKRTISWTPYASGTNGHKGGNALVNDGRGAELVQMPNGRAFIPSGRNVLIPNAPKGMKVLSAERTAQLMGNGSPTFRYASGIGDIDVWSYIDNASGLASKIASGVSYDGLSGFVYNLSQGMVSTFTGEMGSWIDKVFEETLRTANYDPSRGVMQWRSLVARALKMEGQYSILNVARTLFQMHTESGGNPNAINLWDSNAKKGTPSKGLMQVIDPTFNAYARPGFNKNIYDPLSNILASVRYAVSRYGSLAKAYRGVGYANGGIANSPSIFGEDGPEMAIPLSASKRNRGVSLWKRTGQMLGMSSYSPEGDGGYYSSSSVEQNTYAPQFNLTISGADDERALSRKVKRWIAEAMEDTFTGLEHKNRPVREV